MKQQNSSPSPESKIKLPAAHDWRTTDEDEINKRRYRAQQESFAITNTDTAHPIFSNFKVKSPSGMTYLVEIRDIKERHFSCECVDFQTNGLGTCKHVEAVLLLAQAHYPKKYRQAQSSPDSPRIDLVPDRIQNHLKIERGFERLPVSIQAFFDSQGRSEEFAPAEILHRLEKATIPDLRISQDILPWLESQQRAEERKRLRHEYEQKVHSGEWPVQETLVPLFPYQREGMLHLAFTERALLADEMGLGKTIQAIAACALLHRLGKASHVLVVTPASLKTEWEEQIQRFTPLTYQLVFGARPSRLKAYLNAPFFTIVNYEQMVTDSLDVNERLKPDIVVLDEAQRIKNWSTKTAQAIKRLKSRYAFVLTGTPIENRIDELYSIIGFLDPALLGPLFRFNREFYELDERGRPKNYRNLDQLQTRVKPLMLRRRKCDVETELPDRTDKTFFVALSDEQKNCYANHEQIVSRLAAIAKRRPLTQAEQEKLMRELAMMRMICDSNYILDPDDRVCPKLNELEKILEECCAEENVKVIIFSEWERMLELVRDLCKKMNLHYAWHTGSVPQKKRRGEILLFKNDLNCRIFLTTDSGSTGLNLQNASVVINCDLPWNPAKLEQRIARAWRKHQTRSVTVINLVSEGTIEHRMLGTLSDKQALADGILDNKGDLSQLKLRSGREGFLKKLEQLTAPAPAAIPESKETKPLPTDRALAFSRQVQEKLNGALLRCEERYPANAPHSVIMVVVNRDAQVWQEKLVSLHEELFGKNQSDPLAPTLFEVIDHATDEAIKRLESDGLIARTVRASRILHSQENNITLLSEEEKSKRTTLLEQAKRKLKMAKLLASGDLIEEAQQTLNEAILLFSSAQAIKNKCPEPISLDQVILAPLNFQWGETLPAIQEFIANPSSQHPRMIQTLDTLLQRE